MFVCHHSNIQTLSSPPVLELLASQGYLWLPYDLAEVIKLFGVTLKQKRKKKNQKNTLRHSFCIIVIPSILLSFLPDYCHSFRISFNPSELLPFQIFVILNSSGTLPYPKGEKNGHQRWPYVRV